MPFTQDDDVIEAFTPDRSDDPFRERVLPRGSGSSENLVDPHSLKPRAEDSTVGPISIPDQIPWRGLPWKRFPDLLRDPSRCGVRGYAEMHDAATLVVQDDEHEQEPKRSSRYDEEIDRRQTAHMVPKECPPGLRWRLRVPDHVLGDSGLTDLDPKLEKFAVDARCAPQRVFPRNAPDQCPDLRRDWRAASSPWA